MTWHYVALTFYRHHKRDVTRVGWDITINGMLLNFFSFVVVLDFCSSFMYVTVGDKGYAVSLLLYPVSISDFWPGYSCLLLMMFTLKGDTRNVFLILAF